MCALNSPNADTLPFSSPALAGKIKRQSLISFMSIKRLKDLPNQNLLHIPVIDALLDLILNPSLTAAQKALPKRLHLPVIELTSRGSCGKTHLLYLICAIATLPSKLGGKGRAVVIIDCKSQFSVNRLYEVMRGYARQHLQVLSIPSVQLHGLLKTALSHVHIFRPISSAQLLLTIQSLKPYLYTTEHQSSKRRIDSILIDGISSFIWRDRWNDYHAIMISQGHPDWIDLQERYSSIVQELQGVAEALGAYIVVTNLGFLGRRGGDLDAQPPLRGAKPVAEEKTPIERPYLRNALPAPWNAFVNVKIVLRHFHSGEDEERRFVGFSDTVGLGGGLQRAVGEVNGGTGQFWFKITSEGVTIGASANL
ncbi:hypothetical protein DFP73DRAFT_565508 [Morchella snyderi]|nr:hypothetical protein DFP73DRAFT_565508 [Morchella snyderi]